LYKYERGGGHRGNVFRRGRRYSQSWQSLSLSGIYLPLRKHNLWRNFNIKAAFHIAIGDEKEKKV
jgi:hypothetical protein